MDFACPVIAYIVLYVRKRLAENVATWHNLLGTFVFYDNAGKNFLPMLGIVFTSYLLGVATNVTLSSFGVVILPVLAFIVITKHVEYKPKLWEYFLLVTSLYCFNDSQFFFDTPRVVMLVASALGIMVVAIRLNLATKRWFASAVAYILIAFILPVLTIGYNIYVGTNCGRMRNYTDHYITCGVMYVHHNNELGIRCRYRVVMPPQYKRIEPIITPNIYHWRINETGDSTRVLVHTAKQSEVLAITSCNDSVMYSPHGDYYIDVNTREWRFPTTEDLK